MGLSPQDRIQRATYAMTKRLYDAQIQTIGSGATNVLLLSVDENKFHDRTFSIKESKPITCRIYFPNNEIPLRSSTDNSESSTSLMMYDILPIELFCKVEDQIQYNDIIFYKYKTLDGVIHVLPLQVVDQKSKGGLTHELEQIFIVSPVTDTIITTSSEFLLALDAYSKQDIDW